MEKYEKIRLGLDIGTDSVGYAVVDENDELIKKNGKTLWGVRMFDAAQDAKERRTFRGARIRLKRRRERIRLLRDIFAAEISKVDPTFYDRLDDSFYMQEDKRHQNFYNLFTGSYNDKTFNDEFPTIYHLRKHLMESNKQEDIRLLYLVLANMIKFRGNFLRPGDSFDQNDSSDVKKILNNFNDIQGDLANEFENYPDYFDKIDVNDEVLKNIKEILVVDNSKNDKKRMLLKAFNVSKSSLTNQFLIPLIVGGKMDLSKLSIVKEDAYEKCEMCLIVEDLDSLISDKRNIIEPLSKLFNFLPELKSIVDLYYLIKLVDDSQSLSEAMIKKYDQHKKDLQELKHIIKKYLPGEYNECFKKKDEKLNNYPHYIGMNFVKSNRKRFSHCKREDFYSYVNGLLNKISDESAQEIIKTIKSKIENNNYLLRHNSDQNGAIPMQLNLSEMKIILEKQKAFYTFLSEKDNQGLTNSEKIIKIFKFRVPYYVGHLNGKAKNSWIVRSDEKIFPWNFDEVVNLDETAQAFIENMQNKCTYLKGSDDYCLPKNSMIFSEYNCLSYLNKISFNGALISKEVKMDIFNNVFLNKKSPTRKNIMEYIETNYGNTSLKSARLKDLPEVNCNMASYIKFKEIFGDKFEERFDDIEKIIKDIVVFEDKKILEKRLKELYKLDKPTINEIKNLNYSGYSRLSKRLITGITISNPETGEVYGNVLDIMRNTNANLQEILFNPDYRLNDLIEEYNKKNSTSIDEMSLSDFIEENCNISPIMKRPMIQAYTIITEIERILNRPIDEYYIECTRTNNSKKGATKSRYQIIKELYENSKDIWKDLRFNKKELYDKLEKNKDNLRSDALYLYFTQLGKCMYSLEDIDLDTLSQNYDIDHIYPQSLIMDDSLSNRVLTRKDYNSKKSNKFLFETEFFSNPKAFSFYELLRDKGLISKEKFLRLTKKELNKNELDTFVNRQIVATNQAVTGLIDILKFHKNIDSKNIIYSKAENISMFRKEFGIVKSRTANNFHHAHDAYLNVVVGGALERYYRKHYLTSSRDYARLKEQKITINPVEILKYDRYFKDKIIWNKDKTVQLLRKNIYNRFDILETQKTDYVTTMFSKVSILPAGEGNVPVRAKGPLSNTGKYGGINSNSYNKYVIIKQANKKGEVEYILEAIPTKDKDNISKYLSDLGYKQFEIVHNNIKINVVVEDEERKFYIKSKTNDSFNIRNANDRFFSEYLIKTIKKIEKYNSNLKINKTMEYLDDKIIVKPKEKKGKEIILYKQEAIDLVEDIAKRFTNPKFNYSIFKSIGESLNTFNWKDFSLKDLVTLTTELLGLGMTNQSNTANLKLIEMSNNSGTLRISRKLRRGMKFISESVTGYYRKVIFEVPK